jgi:hypothetical protein
MTAEKAKKEYDFMLDETKRSEAMAVEDQKLMGAACKELRLSYGLQRNALSNPLRMDSMQIAELERRCSTEQAKKYKSAVEIAKRNYA